MDERVIQSLEAVQKIIAQQQEFRVRKVFPHRTQPKRRIGQNALILTQRLLHRSLSLLIAGQDAFERKNLIALALVTRAHYETTGTLAYLLKQLQRNYDGELTVEELDGLIFRLWSGSSSGDLPGTPAPINVLTAVDTADKFIEVSDERGPIFRQYYDLLSQYCHPNFDGTVHHTKINEDLSELEFFEDEAVFGDGNGVSVMLELSGGYFIIFFKRVSELLAEHEELPQTEAW